MNYSKDFIIKIIEELLNKKDPTEISNQYSIPVSTIEKWKSFLVQNLNKVFENYNESISQTTMCTYCGVGCKLLVDLEKNKITAPKDYEINKGHICLKGAELYEVSNKNRLKNIFIRKTIKEKFVKEHSWETVLAYIAEKIKKTDPHKIAFYSAGQVLIEDYYIGNKLFKGFIGSPNVDSNSRTCIASSVSALTKIFGVDFVPAQMEDVFSTNLLIIAGSNPAHGHIVFFENYIVPAIKNGVKSIVIDPYKTKTAKFVEKNGGLYIQIRPGGDVNLFNAIAKELFNKKVVNLEFIKKNFNNSEDYIKNILNIDIKTELKKCEVSYKNFEKIIKLIIENKKMMTIWSMGFNQSSEGVQKNIAAINLHLLLNRFGEKGNNPFPLTGQANAMGGREVGGLATSLAVHLDFSEENRKKVSNFWKTDLEKIPKKRGLTITEIIDKALDKQIDILFVMHTDPVYSLPNRNKVENALKNIPLIIEINAYKNTETSKFAHIRLPAKAWGEKEGRLTNMDRHISYHKKILPSPKNAKEDWKILCELANHLDYKGFEYKNADEIYKEFQEMTKLSKEKHLNHFDVDINELKNDKSFVWGENFFTRHKALTENFKPNLIFPKNNNLSLECNNEYPLNLISVRTKNHWNSQTKTRESYKINKIERTFILYINPDDAKKYNLNDEDEVKVISPFGEITVSTVIEDIKQGVVAIPSNNRLLNYLTGDIIDPDSFQPDYNKIPVRLEKIDY